MTGGAAMRAGQNALPERRASWGKLMFNATPLADLDKSVRRVLEVIVPLKSLSSGSDWLAGNSFSLADINVFATAP
jgi:glutathione S-transferase